jgi:hypothetical protein
MVIETAQKSAATGRYKAALKILEKFKPAHGASQHLRHAST